MSKIENETTRLPVVAMRGVVVFPEMVMHFDVARERSIAAVTAAYESNKKIFLTAQKDIFVEEPAAEDLHTIGVIAEVRQILKTPDGVMRVQYRGEEIEKTDAKIAEIAESLNVAKSTVSKYLKN